MRTCTGERPARTSGRPNALLLPPSRHGLNRTVGPHHVTTPQPLRVPGVVVRRRQAVEDEQLVERLHEGHGARAVGGHGGLRVASEARGGTV